jgi:hypothetical protein
MSNFSISIVCLQRLRRIKKRHPSGDSRHGKCFTLSVTQNFARVAGFVDTGHLSQAAIQNMLHIPRPGVTELLCHPAYWTSALETLWTQGYNWIGHYNCETETNAVSDPLLRAEFEELRWTL